MSHLYTNCLKCYTSLSGQTNVGTGLVCPSCGWSESALRKKHETKNNLKAQFFMAFIAFSMLGLFFFTDRWGDDSSTVAKVTALQWTQQAQLQDFETMFQICQNKKRLQCAEQFAEKVLRLDATHSLSLLFLANAKINLGDLPTAEHYLRAYLKSKAPQSEGLLLAAQIFGKQSLVVESQALFVDLLKSAKGKFEIDTARSMIQMLIDNDKLVEARRAIDFYRARGGAWEYFMYKEVAQIDQLMSETQRAIAKEHEMHCVKSGFCSL